MRAIALADNVVTAEVDHGGQVADQDLEVARIDDVDLCERSVPADGLGTFGMRDRIRLDQCKI